MNIRRIIERRIRHREEGIDVAADVNAVIAANVGEPGSVTSASNRQRVVHRSRSQARAEGGSGERRHELTPEELETEDGEELPERRAMSIVDLSPDIPQPIFPSGEIDPYE